MIAFSASTQAASSGVETSSSIHRYGSATSTPKYSSTWSQVRAGG